jgi:hypothetical protein
MPLTPEQIAQINQSNRDVVTRALEHLTGSKRSGSHVDNPDIRQLETALRARLTQLDHLDTTREVSEIIEGTLAIINEGRGLGALPKTDS